MLLESSTRLLGDEIVDTDTRESFAGHAKQALGVAKVMRPSSSITNTAGGSGSSNRP
jgi:hypothetical protein